MVKAVFNRKFIAQDASPGEEDAARLVSITCAHCGSNFEPYGDYSNYEGPVPCIACHKSSWTKIVSGSVEELRKWP